MDDVPSIMLRMKEVYAVPNKHIIYAATKAFFGTKMAEGSSVQSYGVKMLSLVEKLKDLKVGLDNDTYIDETLQPPRRKVRGSDARRGRSKRERLSQPLPAPRAPLLPHWEKANGNGKLEVLSGRRQRKGALKEGVPTTPLQPRTRRQSKDEMILRLGDGKVVAAEAVGSLSLVVSDHIQIELGHISKDRIRKLGDSKSLEIDNLANLPTCESYLKGKITKRPFVGQSAITNSLLYLIHTNICGLLNTPTRGGYSYFITFTNDHSRYGYVYLMSYKSEAFGRFKEYSLRLRIKLAIKSKPSDRIEGYPADSRQDEVLLEESSEAPQQNDATSFEPSIPIDGVVVFHRSTKESRPLERYRCVGLTSQLDNHPKTYKKAMLDINSDKWFEAMKSKMDSMGSNQLWTLVDPPKSVKPIGCKWVYKHKLGVDGEVTAFKARLVAKGYTQSPVVDFKKIYSPVAMAKSIRILLAIAAWRVSLLLEKNRKSVTFKGPSMASNKFSKAGTRILMKSYRDMISSRTSMILVYIRRSMRALLHTLCFMSMTSCSLEMTSRCYATLKHDCPQFFMKDMGEASYILSIKIYRDRSRRMLRLTQSSYIEKVLKRFKMENSKRGHLPMDMGLSCPRSSLPRLRRSLKGSWTSPMLQSWEAFNMLSSAPGPMSPTLPA
ncbi:UNVERIFIED_CONTAM: hypothetical protein Sradi_6653000 [Sesamum radiatum]|uniref:Reverse transcriptase Ty1/copia-type domain-containing protein n=1 Tax=Sesamum radiatum TaxID=300843 RepID=A0AAW2JNJ7_SESRA